MWTILGFHVIVGLLVILRLSTMNTTSPPIKEMTVLLQKRLIWTSAANLLPLIVTYQVFWLAHSNHSPIIECLHSLHWNHGTWNLSKEIFSKSNPHLSHWCTSFWCTTCFCSGSSFWLVILFHRSIRNRLNIFKSLQGCWSRDYNEIRRPITFDISIYWVFSDRNNPSSCPAFGVHMNQYLMRLSRLLSAIIFFWNVGCYRRSND